MALFFGAVQMIEEVEREEQRREARLFRRIVRDAQDPFTISETLFIRHFRLNKEACRALIETLAPHMERGNNLRLPKLLRVLTALNFFATGSYQRSVSSNVLAYSSQPTVSRSIKEVVEAIIRHLLRLWIRFPRNDRERNMLKARFLRRHQMHDIIGVVDGSHVAIRKPQENENIFVNRKGYHSLNCQIICDSQLRILNIVARWPGSTHDAYIWRNSRVGQTMRANFENGDRQTRIMGDSGYACLPWLLVPLPNPRTPQEQRFNQTFKRCRSVVERCIGVLKGRFRCLLKDRVLHYSPHTAAKIIMSCAVLHNMAIHYRVRDPVPRWDEIDLEEVPLPAQLEHDIQQRQLGQQHRRQYIEAYF